MAARYDFSTSIRHFDGKHWLEPEDLRFLSFARTPESWVKAFSAPKLGPQVPTEIVAHFEAGRGAMVYSRFFYPLATLGLENLTRTMELAVHLRAKNSGGEGKNYEQDLRLLVKRGILPSAEEPAWQAGRKLRNTASHPRDRFLIDPGMALQHLHLTTERIHLLFPPDPPAPKAADT